MSGLPRDGLSETSRGNSTKPLQLEFRWCIQRESGIFVPVIAVDELPAEVQLQGVPRSIKNQDVKLSQYLGKVDSCGLTYKLDPQSQLSKLLSQSTSSAPESVATIIATRNHGKGSRHLPMIHTNIPSKSSTVRLLVHDAASGPGRSTDRRSLTQKSLKLPCAQGVPAESAPKIPHVQTTNDPLHRPLPPSGVEPNHGRKIWCTYWLDHGTCRFMQQGCLFKHEWPTDEVLRSIGCADLIPKRPGKGKPSSDANPSVRSPGQTETRGNKKRGRRARARASIEQAQTLPNQQLTQRSRSPPATKHRTEAKEATQGQLHTIILPTSLKGAESHGNLPNNSMPGPEAEEPLIDFRCIEPNATPVEMRTSSKTIHSIPTLAFRDYNAPMEYKEYFKSQISKVQDVNSKVVRRSVMQNSVDEPPCQCGQVGQLCRCNRPQEFICGSASIDITSTHDRPSKQVEEIRAKENIVRGSNPEALLLLTRIAAGTDDRYGEQGSPKLPAAKTEALCNEGVVIQKGSAFGKRWKKLQRKKL